MIFAEIRRSLHHSREVIYKIIFEADTPAGKAFDIVLIWSIIFSVFTVILDSVQNIHSLYGGILYAVEWIFTGLFTIEYILRLYCTRRPVRYAVSFFGMVDLLAILPTYLSVFVPGAQSFLTIRTLRLLRIFRVFKLTQYIYEARIISTALWASRRKISVFLLGVISIVVILGAAMYLVEGEAHGFKDIPTCIYWAIVTITTVGYGDISPQTPLGKGLASLLMIMGYAIIAVPTGIVTVEIAEASRKTKAAKSCTHCGADKHDSDAMHCKHCGMTLTIQND